MTISLSDEMYKRIERARKAAKTDRSSFVQEAVARQLVLDEHAAKLAAYIKSYTEEPETEEEFAFSDVAARETFRALDAEEAADNATEDGER